jgi:hypothetical protein
MAGMDVSSNAREAQIEAVIIRADGTRENLGAVSYWHKNPLRRLWWRLNNRSK